jgi:hypothetical protein
LLTPFADENVPLGERLRLLERCIQHLKRLAQDAPVLVSAAPVAGMDPAGVQAAQFLARLETAADQVWRFEAVVVGAGSVRAGLGPALTTTAPASPTQLRMF